MTTNRIRLLRRVLRANALTSFLTGAIALAAGPWVSRGLGIDHVAVTRLIGAGLIVFAVDVALLSRAHPDRLLRDTLLVSAADLTWVAATVVVLFTGILSTAGVLVAVVAGIAVADFAAAQLWLRAGAATPTTVPRRPRRHTATAGDTVTP